MTPISPIGCCKSSDLQRSITDNASGTTGLGNIAIRWLKELQLPWPPRAKRRAVVAIADSLEQTTAAAERERVAASTARPVLLTSLFSGEHEIPDAYDTLLGTA